MTNKITFKTSRIAKLKLLLVSVIMTAQAVLGSFLGGPPMLA
jgi:hypothetical protein